MVDEHPAVLAAGRVARVADATKKFFAEVGHFVQRHLGKVALQAAAKADEYGAKATYRFLVMAATWRVDPSLVAAAAVEVAARRAALAAAAAAAKAQAASAVNPAAADTPSWRGAAALFDLSTRAPSGAGDATAATAAAPRTRAEPQLLLPARMA